MLCGVGDLNTLPAIVSQIERYEKSAEEVYRRVLLSFFSSLLFPSLLSLTLPSTHLPTVSYLSNSQKVHVYFAISRFFKKRSEMTSSSAKLSFALVPLLLLLLPLSTVHHHITSLTPSPLPPPTADAIEEENAIAHTNRHKHKASHTKKGKKQRRK